MKMPKILGTCLLTASLLLPSISQATCQQEYQDKALEKVTTAEKVARIFNDNEEYALYLIGQSAGYLIFGTATAGVLVYSVGMSALILDDLIEEAIHEAKYDKMIRLINEADYLTGRKERPTVTNYTRTTVQVIGERRERKQAKRDNRKAKKNNKIEAQASALVYKELAKGQLQYMKLYNDLISEVSGVTIEQMSERIAELNESGALCDGTVGNEGRELEQRNDYVTVEGTKKEQRKARRHNKKVNRANVKAQKKFYKKEMALRKHLLKQLIKDFKKDIL